MISTKNLIEQIHYDDYSNTQLIAVPIAVFLLAVASIAFFAVITGSPVVFGVDFVGGSELRITPSDSSIENPTAEIESAFETDPSSIQSVPSDGSYIVTFRGDTADVSELESTASEAGFTVQSSSQVSATFGGDSQRLAINGLLIAFGSMAVIVYILFRTLIPSIAVVASALSDIIVPVAMMNLLGIEMTLGTVAALLLLVGYSIDSDMLLNDYVVRRRGEFYDSVQLAMNTGVSMTLTSLTAMSIMAIFGAVLGVPLLRDIGIIITFGLIVDLMNTYLMNIALLRYYRFNTGDIL